jgi:chromatin remodeling complex protein RSC6
MTTSISEDSYTELLKHLVDEKQDLLKYLLDEKKDLLDIKKKITKYHEKTDKIIDKKINRKKNDKNQTGININADVPQSLKDLFNITENDKVPRTKISKLLHKYLKDNNLKYSENKQIYRVDDNLKKIFNLSDEQVQYINSTTMKKPFLKKYKTDAENDEALKKYNEEFKEFDRGFNFFNLQTYLKNVYNN